MSPKVIVSNAVLTRQVSMGISMGAKTKRVMKHNNCAHHFGRKAATIMAPETPRPLPLKFASVMELSITKPGPNVLCESDLRA